MFNRREYPFVCTVHLDGRHPYLYPGTPEYERLSYESRDVEISVMAKHWNDAENKALKYGCTLPDKWSVSVISIREGH